MRIISDKIYREYQNTHFTLSTFFLRKSCRLGDDVGEKMWFRQTRRTWQYNLQFQ